VTLIIKSILSKATKNIMTVNNFQYQTFLKV